MLARVDGKQWETSVWRDKTHRTLLAVPKHIRGDKADGDVVEIEIEERDPSPPEARRPARRQRRETMT